MEGDRSRNYARRWRYGPSLFFPVLLITIGIVWMLVNYGRVPVENVFRLLAFWPVLLVAAGLSVIFRQISWLLSGLLWIGLGAVFVWCVLFPPVGLPGFKPPEFSHKEFQEPLGGAESATIRLGLSIYPVEVKATSSQADLFTAKVDYTGGLTYDARGEDSQKTIRLNENISGSLFNLPVISYESQDHIWDIGLSPRIPLKLDVQGGPGSARIDLSALQLSSLKVEGSLGSMDIMLPEDSASYPVTFNGSVGSTEIRVPSGATFDLTAEGGTGSLTLSLPKDSGVQITVRSDGMGSLTLPDGYQKIKHGENDQEGVWQNDAYERDETPIRITLDIGVGSVTIE